MKPSEIIKLARRQTGCTLDVVTEEEAYQFLNFIIEDFGADIRSSESGFGFDVVNIDVQAGNGIYTFDEDEGAYSQRFPISKIQSVWLKDNKTNKWRDIPVHFVDKMNPNDFESKSEPMVAFVTRSEINLVPFPKESTQMMIWGWDYNFDIILGGIIVNDETYYRSPDSDAASTYGYPYAFVNDNGTVYAATKTPEVGDTVYSNPGGTSAGTVSMVIDSGDTEDAIWIPKRWHYILVEGLKYRMYGNMGSNFETLRTASRNFYDSEKMKALQNIMDRGQKADTGYYPEENTDPLEGPNLDYLIY